MTNMRKNRYKKYYLYNIQRELLNQKQEELTLKKEKPKMLVLKRKITR